MCRFVFAANAIVALYSLFEMVASVWEISRGATLFPEILQVWFDFGHDQVHTPNVPNFLFLFFFKFQLNYCISKKNDRVGVRVPITVCGLGWNGVGEGTKRRRYVYDIECVLRSDRHRDSLGIWRVSVPRVFVPALRLPGRLFHYQRLSFSPLERVREYLAATWCCFFTVYLTCGIPRWKIDWIFGGCECGTTLIM